MTRATFLLPAVLTASLSAATLAAPAPTTGGLSPSLLSAKTIQVTETISRMSAGATTVKPVAVQTIQIQKPNKVHFEQKPVGGTTASEMMVSDGTTLYDYAASRSQYRKQDAPPNLTLALLPGVAGITPSTKGTSTVLDGKPMILFTTNTAVGGGRSVTDKLWADAKTRLPYRNSMLLTQAGKTQEVIRTMFSAWALNKPVDAAQFAFTPPTGAKEYVEPKVLANGTEAPDFTANDKDGKPVKLSDYKGKVVVLDFWATWCGPCQQSLPHTNAVAKQFQGKNVVVLAVNVWDKQDEFDKWLPKHPEYDAIQFVIDPTKEQGKDVATALYGVSGIPTQFIIDKDGKIAKSFVGYGGPSNDLSDAIKAAGAL